MSNADHELNTDQLDQASGGSFWNQVVHPKPPTHDATPSERRNASMAAIMRAINTWSGGISGVR